MTIKELGTNLDENYRNDLNNNFRELSGFTEAATIALNKANTADQKADSALQQVTSAGQNADSAKQLAQEAKTTANKANSISNSVQEQLNQIVINSSIDPETKQARVDDNGFAYPLLKDRIDAEQKKVGNWSDLGAGIIGNTLIDEFKIRGVNMRWFGAKGNGTTNDATAFELACSFAVASGLPLEVTPGSYYIKRTKNTIVPDIIGKKATIIFDDTYKCLYDDGFNLKGVYFINKKPTQIPINTGVAIFDAVKNVVENVSLEKVKFTTDVPNEDGTYRGFCAFMGKTLKNFTHKKVNVNNFRYGIVISRGLSDEIKGSDLTFKNVETAVYISGSDPNDQSGGYATNIKYNRVFHINTIQQQSNKTVIQGADTFLLEKCDGFTASDITTERASERAVYANCVKNSLFDKFTITDTEGIKIVGKARYDQGLETYAENCLITNVIQKVINYTDAYMAEFYFSKKIKVRNCQMYGGGVSDVCIKTSNQFEDLEITNVSAYDLKRSFFEFTYFGTIPGNPDLGIPDNNEGNYPSGVHNLRAKNIVAQNICNLDYPVFRFIDQGTQLTLGTYRHSDVSIKNVDIRNTTDIFGDSTGNSSNNCSGLIDINDVNGVTIDNNSIIGWRPKIDSQSNRFAFPIQVGYNSKSVVVKHKEVMRSIHNQRKFVTGNLYLSTGSELQYSVIDRITKYEDVGIITVKPDGIDPSKSVSLMANFNMKGQVSYNHPASGDTIHTLIGFDNIAYTLAQTMGSIEVTLGIGEYGRYSIDGGGIVQKNTISSASFDNTNTAGKYCVYKDTSLPRYIIRSRLVAATRVIVDYQLSTI